MKIYQCRKCSHPVYFANVVCQNCRSWLGYLPKTDEMIALSPGGTVWDSPNDQTTGLKYCANHQYDVCNWLVTGDSPEGLCQACDLNNTIPNLSDAGNLAEWRKLELAKHRLVYALGRLGLPLANKMEGPKSLAFDFLAEEDEEDPVMTGHADGLITINTAEADPLHRETTRLEMNERYRTLIGHFRHEVGHYYWDRLVASSPSQLADFRTLFGDERADYQLALKHHYLNGPPSNWQQAFISKYATTHPWEDWAETWAHYLHLLDMLETAYSFGMQISPTFGPASMMNVRADFDPYLEPDFERILKACVPLTFAVNTLNRGMGRRDLYPFIINPPVREKLKFVHRLVRQSG